MLTDQAKANIRWHLGYPVIGAYRISAAGATLGTPTNGFRFLDSYGQLEYKMNNLQPVEEAMINGLYYGAVALVGPQPNPGDTLTVVLSGGNISSPQTMTATAGAIAPGNDGRINLIMTLAALILSNPVLQAAGVIALAPYGTGPYAENAIPLPEVSIAASFAFTMTASGTGMVAPEVSTPVGLPVPSTSLDGVNTIYGFLPILNGLKAAHAGASQNLDTSKADVWTARANEIGQRTSLYKQWQMDFSDFIGIPLNPWRKARPSRTGGLRYA